jgi:UrcA family protein
MNDRKIACLVAAGFVATTLTLSAAEAMAAPFSKDVVVEGRRIDPSLQRRVSYSDLNLTVRQDQRKLDMRIFRTARGLCADLNGPWDGGCVEFAVDSTADQKKAAIERAQRQLAGLPVGPAIAISMVIGSR